jgi:Tol biopolymer transport system component
VLLAIVLSTLSTATASAQYFGRNKVQYKDFDFEVLKTEHFDIYYYPTAKEGVEIAARMAERWHARLGKLLEHELTGRQPLILYASHPDFEQTNTIQGGIGEGTGGVTEPLRRRIILPLGGPLADTDHVIGHELVHAFQFDITTRTGGATGETGANYLPLWFIEGMAEYLSIGPEDAHTAMWLRDAARREKLPSVDDLDDPEYFPYRWGQAFWAYVCGRWGDSVIRQMLAIGGAAGDYRVAIERVLGVTTKELTEQWHSSIRRTFEPVMTSTTPPSQIGRVVLHRTGGIGGDLNVGPALSPDGKRIAFLSERSVFSIDLFIADAATGKTLHKLTSTATDPHYSSLQFIYSAGAWDAASRRLAVATVTSGRPALVIFNADSGKREQEIKLTEVDEVFNPTWSPDGRSIAFTGMSRGLTDLFVYDLEQSATRQLTKDPYADLQPVWAPDGSRIAFATDRFSSKLDVLDIGPYRLALIDPQDGKITQVGAFTTGKNINPQWAPDSRALYFLSDRDGIANIYRTTLDGTVVQLTNISTGVTGITASSPALSIASQAGIAALSVFDQGNHHIHTLEIQGAGTPPTENSAAKASMLPPTEREKSAVADALADPVTGLPPADEEFQVDDYNRKLQLEAVGQPTIGVGADRFGAAIGGGIALFFRDMLGDQSLTAAVQVDSGIGSFSFNNTSFQLAYLNQSKRWNWGIVGGQIPYLSGGFAQDITEINGEPVFLDQLILFRQTERTAAGLVAYPFSSAQRVEFQGGISQMSFDRIVRTDGYSLSTGQLIFEDTDESSFAAGLTLGTSSAALVYDTSVFGATSPVQGQRYRFEVAPTFGGINFTSLLADYRRYVMPAPFYTIAGRIMHYGRFGSGGADERLFPLYIGYPSLVRGYDVGSFDSIECLATSVSSCPAFDRLVGSRMLVGNLEFRFPLLRPFGASRNMYGPLPIEVALFADMGVAWNRGESPEFFGGSRQAVSSAGASFRVNILGFAVAQFDFARPFQRPNQGWTFGFHLTPGF